jgi:DNA mismatch endonuclease, patch repair protein
MDVLTPEQRRHNMSRIRGRDTKPELMLRRGLHGSGLRFRLHAGKLPGRPDLVFPRHHAVVLVHGCFWHGHNCGLFRMPTTRREFWNGKITGNRSRDRRNIESLLKEGWRVLIVWECSLKGPARRSLQDVVSASAAFIRGPTRCAEISGKDSDASGQFPDPCGE